MSEAEMATQPPAATVDPQAEFHALRSWISDHCLDRNEVRRAAYQMAMSAVAHRFMKNGPDESLNTLTSRDLMVLLMYCNGPLAEYVMRVAYFRSLIEGEHDIYEKFNQTLFIPECRAWLLTIVEAMSGRSPAPNEVTVWLEQMTGEEKSVARLIIARVYPDVAHPDWLNDIPDVTQVQHARLAAELCLILMSNGNYLPLIRNYLRANPHVRYAVNETAWGKL